MEKQDNKKQAEKDPFKKSDRAHEREAVKHAEKLSKESMRDMTDEMMKNDKKKK